MPRDRAIDIRYIDGLPFRRKGKSSSEMRVWMRADGALPADPVLHTCLLTYASDMTLLDASLLPHGMSALDEEIMMASLDHAMWFHRSFRADEWFLYAQDTPSLRRRGLARGSSSPVTACWSRRSGRSSSADLRLAGNVAARLMRLRRGRTGAVPGLVAAVGPPVLVWGPRRACMDLLSSGV